MTDAPQTTPEPVQDSEKNLRTPMPCEDCHERPREPGLVVCQSCWDELAELQRKAEHYGDSYVR